MMEIDVKNKHSDQNHEPPSGLTKRSTTDTGSKPDYGGMYAYSYDERSGDTNRDLKESHDKDAPSYSEPWVGHRPPRPTYSRSVSKGSGSNIRHNGIFHAECVSYNHHDAGPKPRPNAIRTQTHHRSKYSEQNVSGSGPADVQNGYQSTDSPSPLGSTSDSGVSSQRSSISRQADSWKERPVMVNSTSFDNTSHMRYYPQISRSVTPDTLTMTESKYDYDTASLPRTPHSSSRAARKLPITSTQRPLRSYSQMDMSNSNSAQRSRYYHGTQNFEALPNRFSPQQFQPLHQGQEASDLVSMSRTAESLQSSQESILTYVEGYGYGHTSSQTRPFLDRTTSFNSNIHQLQSPSIPNLPRHPSPGSGYPIHKRGLPVAPHYASSPAVNLDHSRKSPPTLHDHHSPKYSPVAAIVEEEESEEVITTAANNKKSKRKSTRSVLDVLVHKLSGQSKVTNATRERQPHKMVQSPPLESPPLSPSKALRPVTSPSRSNNRGVPALIGLRNHGNTCYMNSVIQCLSNTDQLAEYFVLGRHQEDLLKMKKNKGRKFGTRGELTEGFSRLLQSIWFLKSSSNATEDFRKVVGKYASQYRGDDQHDAQEFLIWLLDMVHEDLNSGSPKKKFKSIKNSHTKPDQLLAAESRANYLRHNSSFIHDVFHAQFRSSLRCLNCNQQSCTFEPFICLSLPIPQRTTRVIPVVVAFITGEPRVIKIAVPMEASARIAELRGEVAKQCRIAVTRLVLCEVYMGGFYRCFSDQQYLSEIRDQDSVYGIEIPNNSHSSMSTSQMRPYIHGVYHGQAIKEPVTLVVVCQIGYGRVGKRFGQPMAIEIDRNVNLNQLKVVLLKAMGCTNIEDVMARNCSLRIGVFSDQNGNRTIITSQSSRPMFHHIVSSMLQFTASKGEPPHVKAIVEWKDDLTHLFSPGAVDMTISESEDYQRQMSSHSQPVRATLHDCLDLFTQEEKLAADNAWQCMNCHKPQQCTKRLSLWSLPEVLVIHLKRFRQDSTVELVLVQGEIVEVTESFLYLGSVIGGSASCEPEISRSLWLAYGAIQSLDSVVWHPRYLGRGTKTSSSRQKLSTMVEFPVNGLDLSSYVEQNHNQNNQSASMTKINLINNLTKWSQWRAPPRRLSSASQGSECIYDLHAVCNHVGSLSGGHYTAYCKNSTSNQWYHFDDTKISSIPEDRVATRGAYILFYHRRAPLRSGSTESFSHWWLLQDSNHDNLPNGDAQVMKSLPRRGKPDSSPQQEGYINGFGSLRLREVRTKEKRRKDRGGTRNMRALQSQESLDSGIVISNGQADLDGHMERSYIQEEDGGFSTRPLVRGLSDHSPTIVEAEVYRTVPESRI